MPATDGAVPRPPPTLRLLLAWGVVAVLAAVAALALGGGAPEPPPPGLPDAGPVTGWAVRLLRLAGHAAALVAAGGLLAALLGSLPVRRRLVAGAAVAWSLVALLEVVVGLADVVARPATAVLERELLAFYVREVPQGRALLLTAVLAATTAVAVAVGQAATRAGATAALLAVLLTAMPHVVTGHAASAGNHRLAQVALAGHVAAVVLWVGGLGALALLRGRLALAASRFSPLALGCAAAVGVTGAASAWLGLGTLAELWTTGYGGLVLAKSAAFAVLVLAGALHRRRTLPLLAAGQAGAFGRLAAGEVGVMAVALGLAVALARTPLPA
ncbi:MAG TPA: CopD family protein [Mycobacteriales bacterium]|nr:CopD family protein [Mycobacteriales bacterium]